ncbi:MAG: hypothetical protein IPK53_11225 [bacterium]|nr:hypothetical protein [bacterium]
MMLAIDLHLVFVAQSLIRRVAFLIFAPSRRLRLWAVHTTPTTRLLLRVAIVSAVCWIVLNLSGL